jgi:hypothetical protein
MPIPLDAPGAIRARTRRRHRASAPVGLALACMLTLGPPGRADDGPPATSPLLAPGVRVRLTAAAGGGKVLGSVRGTLAAMDSSQITVDTREPGTGYSSVQIPLERVSKLEVSRGRHGHALAGAVFGFAGGAAAGAILDDSGPIGVECPVPPNPCGGSNPKLGWALAGGLVGFPVGALLGHFVRTERWSPVDLPRVEVTAGPLPGRGLRFVARLRF